MSLASKIIVPRGVTVLIIIICLAVFFVEAKIASDREDLSAKQEISFVFKEYSTYGKSFALKFDCNGKEGYLTDPKLISKFLENPKFLAEEKFALHYSGQITLKEEP